VVVVLEGLAVVDGPSAELAPEDDEVAPTVEPPSSAAGSSAQAIASMVPTRQTVRMRPGYQHGRARQ